MERSSTPTTTTASTMKWTCESPGTKMIALTKLAVVNSSLPSSTAAISMRKINTGDPTPTTNQETQTKSSSLNSSPPALFSNPNPAAPIKTALFRSM
ncbi:uncharacterized protein EAE97_011952 [Botrytis byssoidea]|uniref:Uncharacterized protein n=1 Tax=Botrytis byssoidea TaxID=139641 RepID=A0A9P5LQF5_9HELO|nr:uncharacterized protein EAE97_011952 [Botrytis byssoidea]KAF7917814.1 hypothetical protein EAE97_011952 [Botrytis byssoidea]